MASLLRMGVRASPSKRMQLQGLPTRESRVSIVTEPTSDLASTGTGSHIRTISISHLFLTGVKPVWVAMANSSHTMEVLPVLEQ
jgi:hypothetical protein